MVENAGLRREEGEPGDNGGLNQAGWGGTCSCHLSRG